MLKTEIPKKAMWFYRLNFFIPSVSLFTLADIKNRLQDILGVEIDVIHAPLPEASLISPEKVVELYAA